MKRLVVVAILAALPTTAFAEPLSISADVPAKTADEVTRLHVQDQVIVDQPGATAAFSVDSSIVECSAQDGRVTLIARRAGTTTISIVTRTDILTFPLTVVADAGKKSALAIEKESRTWTQWEGRYESASDRVTNSLEMVDGNDRRVYRAYAVNVLRVDDNDANSDARAALPALSAEWRTKRRELVAFDKLVEHSPLTLDGVTVRGGHVRYDGLELHAGVTSPFLYENVFLSTHAETVLGASYEIGRGRQSLTPSVYAYPTDPQSGGTSGAMGSLLYRYRSRGDHLQLAGELGWGGVVGAAGELTYQDSVSKAWISARHQPQGFAALGIGRPLGSMLDALWTGHPSKGVSVNAATSAAHYESGEHDQRVVTASTDLRVKLARHVAGSLGISTGAFDSDTSETVRSITLPVGLHYEREHVGASAVYRYQQNSARNHGGHGGRLSLRASSGTFHASTYADFQQEAASVAVILEQEPVLAQMLDELGLTATTPDELAQLLRENATLAQLGYSQGANLELHPWRAQAGADVAFVSRDKSRQQLRFRALVDRTQTVNDAQHTTSATLQYGRRLAKQIDAMGMVSWWSRSEAMAPVWSFGVGMRVRFDALPNLHPWRSHSIEGFVTDAGSGKPVANVRVTLDAARSTKTDARGHYELANVSGGSHRIEATAPDGTYFASRSEVTAEPGDDASFSLVTAAARLHGTISDDAGTGIASVVLAVRGPNVNETVTTDSRGHFRVAVPAGTYEVSVLAESLPAGFDTSTLAPRTVELGPTAAEMAVEITANRSIGGTVEKGAAIRIVELDRTAVVDADGHYVFRKLPAGELTLEVSAHGKTRARAVELSSEPVSLRNIDFR